MHPILFHLGRVTVSTEGVLVAFGLLAGLQLACLLGTRSGLDPDRLWNLGLLSLLTLFLSERMLVIACNLRDFIDHPLWMLGLATVRDERYFYGGVLLAICAGVGYLLAWRLPWRSVLDALAPGASLALGCASLGALAAGSNFGRPTTAAWGITYTSRVAARTSGTPLGIPLAPVALYAAILYLLLAAWGTGAARGKTSVRGSRPKGSVAGWWLFTAGLGSILLAQLRYPSANEPLVLAAFTPDQSLGILAVLAGAALLLHIPPQRAEDTRVEPQ